MLFLRRISTVVMLAGLVCLVAVSSARANLIVTPHSAPPVIEAPGATTSVSFDVKNNGGPLMILDYALAIINGPKGDDQLNFASVTFPTTIATNATATFTYGLVNPNGDPSDPDNGLSHISFYVEMSVANPATPPAIFHVIGQGVFVFNLGGGSQGVGPNFATLGDLFNCFNAPGAFPNPCPALAGAPPLYTMSTQGTPFPAVANASVTDVPESASLVLLGTGLLGVAGWARLRMRK